jgi:hypothetical protein
VADLCVGRRRQIELILREPDAVPECHLRPEETDVVQVPHGC